MIYKVIGKFEEIDFSKMFDKASKKFNLLYLNKTFFIAAKTFQEVSTMQEEMNKIFKPKSKFYFEEITEKNIKEQSEVIQEWCVNNFVNLQKQKYEIEQQSKLQQVSALMDIMEQQLQEKMIINRKGE